MLFWLIVTVFSLTQILRSTVRMMFMLVYRHKSNNFSFFTDLLNDNNSPTNKTCQESDQSMVVCITVVLCNIEECCSSWL